MPKPYIETRIEEFEKISPLVQFSTHNAKDETEKEYIEMCNQAARERQEKHESFLRATIKDVVKRCQIEKEIDGHTSLLDRNECHSCLKTEGYNCAVDAQLAKAKEILG